MKKIMIVFVLSMVVIVLFGPFNVYHYMTTEKMVKKGNFVFEMIYDDENWEVRSVDYIGKKTYYVVMQNDDEYILQIRGNSRHQQVKVFNLAGGQILEQFSYGRQSFILL